MTPARHRHTGQNFAVSRQVARGTGYAWETPYKPYNDAFLRLFDPTFVLHLPYLIGLIEPYMLNEKNIYSSMT